ncbi:Lipopolysaccharide core biosynthesis glycosyltransferase lpsE [Bacteroidales bacterium CF]|nr:Lipopolysaccharide core biosynthesis glycosyltransferase lpsE [Bacteroidales bacterium CF]
MKNILLISNIYPTNDPSYDGTPICHFFTQEWIKMGYNVRVIHFDSLFPKAFYLLGKLLKSHIQAKTGCVTYTNTPSKPVQYNVDEVPVLFVPIRKMIPHKSFSEQRINKAFETVRDYLNNMGFIPDAVVGHFVLPQLHFLYLFKQKYPQVKTSLVLHSGGNDIPSIYPEYKCFMKAVDVWGFRSIAFKNQFEQLYGKQAHEFLCYSGIPEQYLEPFERNFPSGVHKFSFVGNLYKLKRVEDTLRALHTTLKPDDYSFDIVGDGAESDNLHSLVTELGMGQQVKFHGKQPRDVTQQIIKGSDCFVMVSKREAFGLVYLEAMAKGCITVATRGQGMDGIIEDGKNGFLCDSENIEELSSIISKITQLSPLELQKISNKAFETTKDLTDTKVAERYMNAIAQLN